MIIEKPKGKEFSRSLPLPIKSCHEYSFTVTDRRRRTLWNKANNKLTGVFCKAHSLPGMDSSADTTTFLKLKKVPQPKAKAAPANPVPIASPAPEDGSDPETSDNAGGAATRHFTTGLTFHDKMGLFIMR